tara:strand:+ start:323 stop:433 length:111 start_codon:yes stop_codon:yes gene_type:complete
MVSSCRQRRRSCLLQLARDRWWLLQLGRWMTKVAEL